MLQFKLGKIPIIEDFLMNGIDYANNLNRQREVYQKNLEDARRNHKEEVENLKKSHEYREKTQAENHTKQVRGLEEGHAKAAARIQDRQTEVIKEKNKVYEESLMRAKKDFHKEKRENLRNWDQKFSNLRENFTKTLKNTSEANIKDRSELKKNYDQSVEEIRETANKNLEKYVNTNERSKENADFQSRLEKKNMVAKLENDRHKLLQDLQEQKNFLKNNSIKDSQEARELQDKRYIDGRNLQEKNFRNMTTELNDKVDKLIIDREEALRETQVKQNQLKNQQFKKRYNQLAEQYNKDVRKLAFQKRAEAISQNEVNKEIDAKYKDNMKTQLNLQKETSMRERYAVEERYGKLLRDTVESYQDELKNTEIDAGERIVNIEARLTEKNRQDKYEDRQDRERMMYDHSVSLKYIEDKNAAREADARSGANKKIESLKESFNESMEAAREQSEKNFALTREAMLEDKKQLSKRLREQNAEENAQIKGFYQEKLSAQQMGYEKRIKSLEAKVAEQAQSASDSIRNIMRKTNLEVERQAKAARESAKNQIAIEREAFKEKEIALKDKIVNLEQNFTEKINKQSIAQQKKIKDVQFAADKKIQEEKNKFQDIIEQNSKFMAREFQRLKIASTAERQRLISQYEDRIAKMQRVYREQAHETEQYNQLNKTS